MELRFVTNNIFKFREMRELLSPHGIELIQQKGKYKERQIENLNELVSEKAYEAFSEIGRPVIVEHTALMLDVLEGMPGGLTQTIWDRLKKDKFAELYGRPNNDSLATAKTVIGYIDGKRLHLFEGEIHGYIIDKPQGNPDFQWDCIFKPKGYDRTFAEMSMEYKNKISMRAKAVEKFVEHIKKSYDNY